MRRTLRHSAALPHLHRHVAESWLARIEGRAGPLLAPAQRFVRVRLGLDLPSFVGGPQGLRELARAIDRWLDRDPESVQDEQSFIEEAGALLGLLLIGHLSSATHVAQHGKHRIALGRHGCFDPFAAVERVLDADDVRKALAQEVVAAEDEARGRGPISRAVTAFGRGLALERPHLHITAQLDCLLTLEGTAPEDRVEVDLTRLASATAGASDATLERAVQRFLSLLPGSPEVRLAWAEAQLRLVPRLARLDAMDAFLKEGAPSLFRVPLREPLCVAFLIEHEGRARYLQAREVEQLGVSARELEARALDNLLARSSRFCLVSQGALEHGSYLCARSGDGRDSARLLLDSVLRTLRERLGPDLSLAIPHRDTFFACASGDRGALDAMTRRAREDCARAPHGLTPQIFQLRGPAARLRES